VPFPGLISRTSSPVCLDMLTEDEQHAPLEDHPGAWAIHGLLEALARPGPRTFCGPSLSAVRRALGPCDGGRRGSLRVLTERLRGLEAEGILYRECEPTIPSALTYAITKRVRVKDIKQVLDEFNRLAQTWQQEDACQAPGIRGQISSPTAAGTPSSGKPDLASSRLPASPSAPGRYLGHLGPRDFSVHHTGGIWGEVSNEY
jgi:DNA-binding HxlR family transcriptional regulator